MSFKNEDLLEVENLSAGYSGGDVIHDISIRVKSGNIVVILGANGAGKSTILRCISGIVKNTTGQINWNSRRIDSMAPYKISRLGLAHVPEGRGIFAELSVRQNLDVGLFGSPATPRKERGNRRDDVYSLFPRLRDRADQAGGTLSGGEQQMLAIGRGLMADPGVLLLDEPSLGLAPVRVQEVMNRLVLIKSQGVGVLMVDQNVRAALGVADYVYVISQGRLVREGDPQEFASDEILRQAYLGEA